VQNFIGKQTDLSKPRMV